MEAHCMPIKFGDWGKVKFSGRKLEIKGCVKIHEGLPQQIVKTFQLKRTFSDQRLPSHGGLS